MSKGPSPLLGYNTNVRHKGRVFHIQTEDSGVNHPHVITHLFADGGRILKSTKTSYADKLDAPDFQVQVKKIMQDQHKAMFIALRAGQFDHLIDPGAPAAPPPADISAANAALFTGKHPAQPAPAPSPPSPAGSTSRPAAAPAPSASAPQTPPVRASIGTMPALRSAGPSSPSPPAPAASSAVSARADRSGRYAPVRTPDVFSSFKKESTNIFGDDLVSEKSLDEVILAYLAEDLEESKR